MNEGRREEKGGENVEGEKMRGKARHKCGKGMFSDNSGETGK